MNEKYIKISAKDVCVYPDFQTCTTIGEDGEPYEKKVKIEITENNAIKKHCVANMITTFLGLRPVKEINDKVFYSDKKLEVPCDRLSIDKKFAWIEELADNTLYSIDSTIFSEIQSAHKPFHSKNKGFSRMNWLDALYMLRGDKNQFFAVLKFFEELTGVRPETDKIDFETYADRYVRNKVDYSVLNNKKWCQNNIGTKDSLAWLKNQLDKFSVAKKSGQINQNTYNQHIQGNNPHTYQPLFNGICVHNDVVSTPINHYTFDVSFYIPVELANQLLDENRDTINSDKSFEQILSDEFSVFYLGSPAVVKSTQYTREDYDYHYVKDGSTLE